MEARKAKLLGILVILVAFIAFAFNSLRVTQFSIQDNNPTTYIIVVMLMLPLAILFSMRENLSLETKPANMAAGALLFALYFIIMSVMRGSLSFIFQAYRLDALLFPLALAALIVTLFGFKGLKSMRFVLIYSLFASPLLLFPLTALNAGFTSVNASFIYYLLKAVGVPVVKQGLVISAGGASHISIASTCTDIGAFIAILMFLLPVAYLFYGKLKNKVLWLLSGIGLMLLLNVLRMFAISMQWAYYGIDSAVATLHTFAGQVLFDIAIVIMVLIAGKYGLRVPAMRRSRKVPQDARNRRAAASPYAYAVPIAVALAIGVLGLIATLPYSSALYSNPLNFTDVALPSNSTVQAAITSSLEYAHTDILYTGTLYGSMVFSLQNITANSTQVNTSKRVFVLAGIATKPLDAALIGNASSLSSKHTVILRNGITVTSASVKSNSTLYVSYFSAPMLIAGNETTAYYEFLAQKGSAALCAPASGPVNRAQSAVYSMLSAGTANDTLLCAAYAVASNMR